MWRIEKEKRRTEERDEGEEGIEGERRKGMRGRKDERGKYLTTLSLSSPSSLFSVPPF
jgi:hypothetical protein